MTFRHNEVIYMQFYWWDLLPTIEMVETSLRCGLHLLLQTCHTYVLVVVHCVVCEKLHIYSGISASVGLVFR